MRYVFGFMCVLALGVMGCSETAGTGGNGGVGGDGGSAGSGGVAGTGGSAGSGGSAGTGGMGGSGGTGGMGGVGGSGGASLCDQVTCADTECKIDGVCDADDGLCDYTLVENGTACSLGECLNGVCALGMPITVGCTNNMTDDVSMVRFDLKVDPGQIAAGSPFAADLTGVVFFPEFWLDWLHEFRFMGKGICGGVRTIELRDLAATVSVRSGASGADVELGIDVAALSPGPTRLCNYPRDQVCDCPAGTPSDQRCSVDSTVCLGGTCEAPILLQDIPVINGTPLSPGGCDFDDSTCWNPGPLTDCDCSACAALDVPPTTRKAGQCLLNGFCVNGDLPLRLEQRTGNYIADPVSGTPILFGWFDGNPPVTNPDGTMELPEASFALPVPPIGVRWFAGGLAIPFQCLMGVDSGGPYGIGIPDQASPTPDSLLITFVVP